MEDIIILEVFPAGSLDQKALVCHIVAGGFKSNYEVAAMAKKNISELSDLKNRTYIFYKKIYDAYYNILSDEDKLLAEIVDS